MTLHCGDCREVMATMDDASVDAVVTDPPYGLEFMGKEWDSFKGANDWGRLGDTAPWGDRPKGGTDPFQRDTPRFHAGQPYQAWCETWARECYRVLRPGGHLLAFGGTRTYHRLACAIEDAGFEIRDSLHWIYGSGFPKSRACLKPSHEPIVLARKPAGRMVPLNIDGCRVEGIPPSVPQPDFRQHNGATMTGLDAHARNGEMSQAAGRWPPNVLLGPEAAAELDQQGARAGCHPSGKARAARRQANAKGMFPLPGDGQRYGDDGMPSRYFPVFKYQAKAPRSERPRLPDGTTWPTVKPLGLMRWLVRLVTPPGGRVLDPFAGTGTTGEACALEGFDCVLIEQDPKAVELARIRLGKPVQPMMGV